MMIRRSRKGDARRGAKGRATQRASGDSYGRLFEAGREEELRRALAVKVHEGLLAPDRNAMERIESIVNEVISEREGGWHFALSTEQLSDSALFADDASAGLCADCEVPGCCYFDVVRLTSEDVGRLSRRPHAIGRGVRCQALHARSLIAMTVVTRTPSKKHSLASFLARTVDAASMRRGRLSVQTSHSPLIRSRVTSSKFDSSRSATSPLIWCIAK